MILFLFELKSQIKIYSFLNTTGRPAMISNYSLHILFLLLLIGNASTHIAQPDNGSVEHKNDNVLEYLNEIGQEQEEKTQILKHIFENKFGSYLDLGTGGDSVAHIINKIPENQPITLMASDIDQSILDAIPLRHPEVVPFLQEDDTERLRLKLLRMDATNMATLSDNSIDGIAASALVHEIFSYVPTKSPLDQFFSEIIRVLKKEGVFVFRDPKWDDNPKQDCLLILKDPVAKFFTCLFLPRFLDRKFTERKDYNNQCIKPSLYAGSHIRINYFSKGCQQTRKVKLEEFINTPLASIDFTRNISIESPRGLISEIQRHYILFLKNVFFTDLVDKNFFERELINIENLPPQERTIFKCFLHQKNIQKEQIIETSLSEFQSILQEKKRFYNFIENGLWATIIDKEKLAKICNNLYSIGINPNLIFIQGEKLWADAKIATLLFNGLHSGIFECVDKSTLPLGALNWIKREGEEYYFYKTSDEFITYVGKFTKYFLKQTDKHGYILCPMNPLAIQTVSRDLYKTIVESHMLVMDIDGNKQDIIFDKNIIHFKLMKIDDALSIYKEILRQDKQNYPKLKEWIEYEF